MHICAKGWGSAGVIRLDNNNHGTRGRKTREEAKTRSRRPAAAPQPHVGLEIEMKSEVDNGGMHEGQI